MFCPSKTTPLFAPSRSVVSTRRRSGRRARDDASLAELELLPPVLHDVVGDVDEDAELLGAGEKIAHAFDALHGRGVDVAVADGAHRADPHEQQRRC
jgi:hypothetical protein